MLEEDEKFYATFPEALRAVIEQHWRHISFRSPGFHYCLGPGAYTAASVYNPNSFDAPSTQAAGWEYRHTPAFCANPRRMSDASYSYSSSIERPPLNAHPLHSIHHGWAEGPEHQTKWEVDHLIQHYSVRVC
jgi:hypothetical protein